MSRAKQSVDSYVRELDHPRVADIDVIRSALLSTCAGVTEQIKWNAPSFGIDGDDRITFRFRPGDRVELVLHRGARTRDDAATFSFDDPAGLVTWATTDRGVITFPDGVAVDELLPMVVELAGRWLHATRD